MFSVSNQFHDTIRPNSIWRLLAEAFLCEKVPRWQNLDQETKRFICCCSVAQLCPTLCDPMDCSTSGFPVLHHLLEPAQTHVHWVGDAVQSTHPWSSPLLLPSIFPSIRVFPSESVLHIRWPKYYSFSFSISPSNEYSGLISFRIDWLDLLTVQGTLKSLLQYTSKSSILWRSAFFIVQLSHPYMTTVKTIALTRQTFFGKVMSLLFSMWSRFVIAFFQGASIF